MKASHFFLRDPIVLKEGFEGFNGLVLKALKGLVQRDPFKASHLFLFKAVLRATIVLQDSLKGVNTMFFMQGHRC